VQGRYELSRRRGSSKNASSAASCDGVRVREETVSTACKDVRNVSDMLLSYVQLGKDADADKSEGVAPRGSPPRSAS
jgi:hypothetical protein